MDDVKDYDELFNTKKTAKYLGDLNPNTLAVWRCTKRVDLKPIKIGGRVMYKRSELDKYRTRNE